MLEIKLRFDIEEEDLQIEGSFDTGNKERDEEIAEEIKERLRRGDQWAWLTARMEARVEVRGEVFIGVSAVGGCSYKDLDDFKKCGMWDDLRREALAAMRESMKTVEKRAEAAVQGLLEMSRGKVKIIEEE